MIAIPEKQFSTVTQGFELWAKVLLAKREGFSSHILGSGKEMKRESSRIVTGRFFLALYNVNIDSVIRWQKELEAIGYLETSKQQSNPFAGENKANYSHLECG